MFFLKVIFFLNSAFLFEKNAKFLEEGLKYKHERFLKRKPFTFLHKIKDLTLK